MHQLLSSLFAVVLMAGCTLAACAQTPDVQAERKARILANLIHQLPQLDRLDPRMGDLSPAPMPGFDLGSFSFMTQQGRQQQAFLVSTDDRYLYLIAAGPFDVSRSQDELAQAEEEARQQRHEMLMMAARNYPTRGNPDAPITIVEFSDFQCPYCSRASGTVKEVLAKYPDDVRLVYAHFPLNFHAWARPSAIAAVCAAEQDNDAFWKLHDYYFANQQAITPENVIAKSRDVLAGTNVDLEAWQACAADTTSEAYQAAARRVDAEMQLGVQLGVTGTPGFFINGRFLNGSQPLEAFEQAIQAARKDGP